MKYVINPTCIECGDILIEKNPEDRAIIEATNCEYTHAVLCDSYPTAYEASGFGVTEISLYARHYDSPDDVILLRPNDFPDKTRLLIYLTAFVKELFGTRYGTREARRMENERPDVAVTPNRQICTRLVSQAYDRIGIKLVDNVDYPLITELLNSDKLSRVQNFLHVATPEDLQIVSEGNPGLDEFPFFMDTILSHARELYEGKDIQSIAQLVQIAYKYAKDKEYKEKDVSMEGYLRENGYFLSVESEIERDPHLYDFDEFMKYTDIVFGDLGKEKLISKRLALATINAEKIARECQMQKNDAHELDLYCREVESTLIEALRDNALNRMELNEKRLAVKHQILKHYGLE